MSTILPKASQRQQDPISLISRDTINEKYRRGYLTKSDYEELMQKKGHDEIFQSLERDGFSMTVLKEFVKEINDHWPTMKDIATKDPEKFDPSTNAMMGGWTAFQMYFTALNALGKTTGHQNELISLGLGMDPGAARMVNLASDVGTGFVPVGKMAKSMVTTVEHVTGRAGVKESAAAAQKLAQAEFEKDRARRLIQESINSSMTTDERFAIAASRKPAVIPTEGFKPPIPETTPTEAPLSVQERISKAVTTAENKVTNEQAARIVDQIAKKEGLDLTTIFQDRNYTNKQMYAYLTILRPHIDELTTLAKSAVAGGNPERYAFAKYVTELVNANPSGGSGKNVTDFSEMLLHWDPNSMAKGDIVGAIQTMAKDFAVLDPNELKNVVLKAQKEISGGTELASVWDKTKSVYRNMLLPFAWAPAFVGNSIALGQHEMERVTGRMFSGTFGVVPDISAAAKDAYYFNKGITLAVGDALAAFKGSFGGVSTGELSRFDTMRPAFSGKLGRIIETPTDLVRGVDNFSSHIIERAISYAENAAWAERQGLKGDAIGEFVINNVKFPNDTIINMADKTKKELTFQSQLGWFGRTSSQLAQNSPLFFYAPFMKSYINIAKYEWARTPGLQLVSLQLYKDLAGGGRAAELAVGKLIIGNLTGHLYYEMAKEGYITGSGPSDSKLRAEWLRDHQPYSIKTPVGWVSYKNYEPLTAPMGFMADLAQMASTMDEPTFEKAFYAATFAGFNNFAGGNWWQTGTDLVEAIQEMRSGKGLSQASVRVAMSPITTPLSGGVIGGRIEKIIDPTVRETRSLYDEWAAKTPYFSTGLRALTDPYGDPIKLPETPGNPLFGLITPIMPTIKPFAKGRVQDEGDLLKAKLPNTNDHFMGGRVLRTGNINEQFPEDKSGIQLDQMEQQQRVMLYQQFWQDPKNGLEAQVLNDMKPGGYNDKETTRAGRRYMFENAMKQYWDASGKAIIIRNPSVARRYIESQAKPFYPLMTPGQQDIEKQRVGGQIQLFERMTPQERENFLRWDPLTPEPQNPPSQPNVQMGPEGIIQ